MEVSEADAKLLRDAVNVLRNIADLMHKPGKLSVRVRSQMAARLAEIARIVERQVEL